MLNLRGIFSVLPIADDNGSDVWQCSCGSIDQWLRRDGSITCSGCSRDNQQEWDWEDGISQELNGLIEELNND